MSPRALVATAAARGVQILALTDHNSARNTPAFERLARSAGLLPLCGLEVTTVEELHCLALFETAEQALDFGELVLSHLTKVPHKPEKWGDQVWVDETDNILGEEPWYLGMATDLSLEALGPLILAQGGLFIPAHVDRASQSILSQIGYLPAGPYSALELRGEVCPFPAGGLTLVRGSDAHYLADVGKRTCVLEVSEASFGAVKEALERGRVE